MTSKEQPRRQIGVKVLAVVFWVVVLAAAFAVRLWIAGGEVRCVFSEDPALCATVGEIGR